ncbi:CMGC/MAPK protein kinase [Phytophthora megakarya]|uniref:CMGC/MAPK protein kinase n=1 Tax=Phytophthora megakarya TaxID=4795 RepID=A0A225WK61_9STRA|nr:CMGC/MAPK protein kinase [Phytophthora megakarya]
MGRDDRSVPVMTENGFAINGCSFNVDPKYQPVDAIGQGSYGVVCSVRNTETDEKLAIKKITPMAGDEWDATHTLREIRLMRCLGAHENIISLKDLSMCKEKDELYMMMELADTDLHRLIQSSCPLTEGHIRVIMYQVLSGVKAMHDNGVLHRDLKPGNLLLNKDCELKITDFGLARMMPKKSQSENEQNSSEGVSMMTEYVVTRWYRPPELMLAPNGSYDGAVDMWSVGCILGELISRKPLFPGTDFMDQLTRVFQVLPVPEPEDRGYVIEKDALKFLSSLPPPAPGALETKLGDTTGYQAMDLLRRLLCFNPKERISADEALAHPFFEGVQEEWGEITPLRLSHSLEFAFETQSLPLATLRKYICDEVLAFGDHTTKDQPEPHDKEPQSTKIEKAAVSKTPSTASTNNNDSPPVLENDCPVGSGFTLKGCDFNVPTKYKPLQVLGEGSYGIVCAAADTETKKNVAIKKITPMAGDEWDAKHTLREIRLMRYFGKHPNIASLQNLSTCIEKDELYLMMDLVDTDLHRLIQNQEDQQPRHTVDKTQELMTEYVVTRWYRPPEIMLAPTGAYNEAQALAHPYFKSIRAQLGEPPAFRVDKSFDFEFDYHEFSLAHLKMLIQSEVKLLQKDGLPPPIAEPEQDTPATTYEEDDEFDEVHEQEVAVPVPKQEVASIKDEYRSVEEVKVVGSHTNTTPSHVSTQPEDDSDVAVSKTNGHAEPEADECQQTSDSESDNTLHKAQRQQQEDEEVELIPPKKPLESTKQNNDEEEKPQRMVKTVGRSEHSMSRTPMASESSLAPSHRTLSAITRTTKTSSSLARPKSAGAATRRTTPTSTISTSRSNSGGLSYRSRDSRDEDEVSSIASTSSNNRYHHSNNNGLDSVEHGGKWGHSRTHAMASTASSRLHRSGHSASTSSLNDRRSNIVKTAPITARIGTSKVSTSSSNNQLSTRGGESIDRDSIKSDALRGPERVSSNTTTAVTTSSLRRQTHSARPASSARKESLPEGWIRRTHSKSGREYFYDTLNKVASWKLPVKQQLLKHQPLDNIFSGSSSSSTSLSSSSRTAYGHRQNIQIVPGTSSTASSPSSALTPESNTSRGSMLSSRRTGSSNLPKEWARRSDPKTGRLFYVNLVTNRTYAKLPSSVTAAMLNLGRESVVNKRAAAEALNRKKATVPHSPQFSQMSWQRKRVPNTDD